MKFLGVVLAALFAGAIATSVPFTKCGDGVVDVNNIDATPFPLKAGDSTTIKASGNLRQLFTGGQYTIKVLLGSLQIYTTSGDVCQLSSDFKCPVAAGPVVISKSLDIPSIAPTGEYTIILSVANADSTPALCVSLNASISSVGTFKSLPSNTGVPFTTCSTGDITPSSLDVTPFPPVAGKDVTITAQGQLSKDLTEGSFELDVALDGITLVKKTGDVCTFSPSFKCPQKAGAVKIDYTVNVPSIAPAGHYTATLKANHADSTPIICVSVNFDLTTAADESAHPKSIIDTVNQQTSLWQAGPSARFIGSKMSDVQSLCGSLPGGPKLAEKVVSETFRASVNIPASFDARDEWGSMCASVKEVRDQGACGSCWAVAAAAAMTDRVCILSKGQQLFHLSSQDLVSCCGWGCGFGCDGGFPSGAWSYFTSSGLVTGGAWNSHQGCYPYQIASCDHHVNGTRAPCGSEGATPSCQQTCQNGADWVGDKHKGAKSYSISSNVADIQTEILQNGPVEATFTVYADFVSYRSGVYHHVTGDELGGHAIKIIGWGEENGSPYWLVANSWNEDWGDKGFFKILRGQDECGIESGVVAGTI
eukprot:TRINITY_DN2782_c0_g1_i3.p1 TRINITY_DN2782_c0_g1~~TRINITY_DN2782_c0_g1_i3.p1  ORF type:complete len:591 (-),score=162.89 TRINITY_DN2782_c0_g1_i3:2053-3825(-)